MTNDFTEAELDSIQRIAAAAVDARLSSDRTARTDHPPLRTWGLTRREALILLGSVVSGASVGYVVADESEDVPTARSGESGDDASASVERTVASGRIASIAAGELSSTDPHNTDTPIQEALDRCGEAGGGTVVLPPTTIESPGNIVVHSNVSIVGFYGVSEIAIVDPSAHGLVYDTERSEYSTGEYIVCANIDGVSLTGPGMDAPEQGHAIHDSGRWRCRVGDLRIDNWSGTAWYCDGATFACTHHYVLVSEVDAGDDDAVMHWVENGSPNHFDVLEFFPRSTVSGRRSTVVKLDGGYLHVNVLKSGQDGTGTLLETNWVNGFVANCVNWEPTGSLPAPDSVFDLTGSGVYVRHLTCWNATVEYVYRLTDPLQGYIALPERREGFSWTENAVGTVGADYVDADHPVVFTGSSAHIDEEESGAASTIAPLADLIPHNRDR